MYFLYGTNFINRGIMGILLPLPESLRGLCLESLSRKAEILNRFFTEFVLRCFIISFYFIVTMKLECDVLILVPYFVLF